ncbi:C4-dicarboxylate transport transcriptional regulatory protein DctD [uncultured delta proteobacterium]|uniref:C4-dicarboxylate transport transcriptional regulatory protein DctD n=1 Tax=uncultured delta proteobacterium TaxID=34034 RepID=A0A212JN28_9DELT|nr:C4-dicarboxylate transport transcriptional regulatory protein DctD [uncultured delta proteobacterium]
MTVQSLVYVVDDDSSLRLSVRQCLELMDFTVHDFDQAENVLEKTTPLFEGVILSDVRMPGMDGLTLLRRVRDIDKDLPVILITAHGDVATAVEAMQDGAYDFIEKPFDENTLVDVLRRALEKRRLVLDLRRVKTDLAAAQGLDSRFVGAHPGMREIKRRIMDIAPTAAAVLLCGETGTGKEVVARCLHDCSPRKDKPFVVVDCASIPLSIAESELFGYVKGAFTGADRDHMGKLEAADGGTLFLDEINSLPLEVQGKLLRALQEKAVTPVGAHVPKPVDFRVISSTNEDLRRGIEEKRFREDLYYRLATIELNLPPLRQHKEDIPLLFGLFLEHAAATYGREVLRPDNAVIARLMAHAWPGNVRELRNMADRYLFSGASALDALAPSGTAAAQASAGKGGSLTDHVNHFERQFILDAMRRHKGDMRAVMEDLGLPRRTLNEKMTKLGISRSSVMQDLE